MKPQPIETAPRVLGTRILAYVNAAESADGWMEMEYTGRKPTNKWGRGFESVIDHPMTNACLHPIAWLPVPDFKQEF